MLATAGGGNIDEHDHCGQRHVGENPAEILAEMEMTAEEYRRAFAPDAKTYTTAEVLAYLRSLK